MTVRVLILLAALAVVIAARAIAYLHFRRARNSRPKGGHR